MRGVIYSYELNNKLYIGKTLMAERKRKSKHKYEAFKIQRDNPFGRAIRKYGWEETVKSYKVVEEIFADDKKELNALLIKREDFWIRELNTIVPNGYNIYKKGQDSLPYIAPIDKEEMYEKISNSLKGKYLNNVNSREVYCVELDKLFPSVSEAAREIGCHHSSIQKAAMGKTCKAAGYTWHYKGEKPRESKIKSKEIICVETGKKFKSIRDAARSICENSEDEKELAFKYSRMKSSIKNGWACCGFHWITTGKATPCYQTRNQFGSVTTIS